MNGWMNGRDKKRKRGVDAAKKRCCERGVNERVQRSYGMRR
jgi:hypothetical protein